MRVFLFLAAACAALGAACDDARDLRLINGKIATMDQRNSIVSEVTIQDGRFAAVGKAANLKLNPCTKTIDLKGHTAVPGLIDNHNHIVLFGMRPGYDIRLETAASVADVQRMIKARAANAPKGAFITTLGDWNIKQFAEKRLPTLQELDDALPDHPYIMNGGGGTVTNSLGKKFFESKGVMVSPAGAIAGPNFLAALNALRAMQTFADMKRGTIDAMAYLDSFGVTTSSDMGAFALPGSPDLQEAAASDTVESLNPWTMYDAFLALHKEKKMTHRLRIFFLTQDTRPDVPLLRQRLLNSLPDFGDDMIKVSGIGEFAAAWRFQGGTTPTNYETALQLVAKHGWAFQQHTLSLNEDQFTTGTFEKVNAATPIADLHWAIGHVPKIDRATLDRLKAIGAGVAVHGWLYLSGTPANGGPPFRTIVDSGIHVGAGSDAAAVSVFDPWLEIYYMVTGKNCAGELINDKQQLTRQEALRLYTAENGWYTHEENTLGSIQGGKLADVAVLSDDYFDPKRVSDEGIKQIRSVLTIVGGKIVWNQL
ncbi:MAG: amidohydrolase family protein [Bryobacterales bacterium]|nr:amidohydrolase family protein [Bryobacterales bacterium]MBV9401708.1 amidohydrolase family protein [Bryobacterales bacterium]